MLVNFDLNFCGLEKQLSMLVCVAVFDIKYFYCFQVLLVILFFVGELVL